MAVASGVRNLPYLFMGTLTAMLIANPLYAAIVARFPMRRFVGITYGFFAVNLLAFYVLWRLKVAEVAVGRTFFVWTSVFNLFVPSVFWGVMADTFHQAQAKRLFGVIAVGGTAGAVSGAAITSFLVERVGVANLLLVSATFVVVMREFPLSPLPASPITSPYPKR